MKNCCGNSHCNRPFGLIRYSWGFEQFCSTECRETYKRQRERDKTYWKWLFKRPEPSRSQIADRVSGTVKELS